MTTELQQLIDLSQYAAPRTDWVQGPGGNTSIKRPDGTMLVKASGCLLQEVEAANGWVQVRVPEILQALQDDHLQVAQPAQTEQINQALLNAVVHAPIQGLRPSMETAFHCLFDTCVLHTHNVYANLLLCSDRFEEIADCFTDDEPYTAAILKDYYTPGAELSWWIWQQFRFEERPPNIVFMPNHGIIISAPTIAEVMDINNQVQQKLLQFLRLEEGNYPAMPLTAAGNTFTIKSEFVAQSLGNAPMRQRLFEQILFPDQAVYLNGNDFSDTNALAPLYFDRPNGLLHLQKTYKEARTIAELITALCWLYGQMDSRGWEPLTINYDVPKLLGMSSEQYRREKLATRRPTNEM